MSSPGGRLARSDLHQLVFPAAQTDLLAVGQSGFPVGVRMSGLEMILALAGFAAADGGIGHLGLGQHRVDTGLIQSHRIKGGEQQGRPSTTALVYSAIL